MNFWVKMKNSPGSQLARIRWHNVWYGGWREVLEGDVAFEQGVENDKDFAGDDDRGFPMVMQTQTPPSVAT